MKNFSYKKYTTEESAIYNDSIEKILKSLREGRAFDESCKEVEIVDANLKDLIFDDAMKVMIAELHYRDGMALIDVAQRLKVPVEKISIASLEMLEDVAISSSQAFNEMYPDFFKEFNA
ncbi:MAG: hypothetical protein N3A59_02890 [Thermodesulfovibrionales bacterium]|nr:hypothetical protein [Thermodesulfovibrionales bacterium]